ncbi:MAG: gliding motility protein GldL [Prevotella sp.]|nr:gliding motility protein GldL [Prevotella sp.]
MTRYSKFNIIYWLQKWMDSVPGQTFLNYAYSWGASIVILGTLFKLTHIEGANLMLFIGMGTEVFVFFISAFDRPFDKTTDGMDLQTHYGQPATSSQDLSDKSDESDLEDDGEGLVIGGGDETEEEQGQGQRQGQGQVAAAYGGGGIVIGGGGTPTGEGGGESGGAISGGGGGGVGGGTIIIGGGFGGGGGEAPSTGQGTEGGQVAAASGPTVSGGIVPGSNMAWIGQQQQVTPEMAEATENYVEELKKLTELLVAVSDQSSRLQRDSEEMENLNRTLTGISKVYEMQLKSASQQIGTIDQINEQSRKLAQQIEQLNQIYARMIEAMTVNMRGGTPPPPTPNLTNL